MSKQLRPSLAALALVLAIAPSSDAATDGWLEGHTGLWTEPTNWTLGSPPGPTDDVVFLGSGTTPTYTTDAPSGVQLNSLYVNSPNAAVHLSSPNVPSIDVEAGYVSFYNGLSNTHITGFSPYTTVVGNSTNSFISNITLSGSLRMLTTPVTGTLTFDGGELHLGNLLSGNVSDVPASLYGNGSIQGTGTVVFDGPASGGSTYGFNAVPSGITLVSGLGSMEVGTLTNNGSIVVNANRYLFLNGTFTNNGSVLLNNNSAVVFSGWNGSSALGNFTRTGGSVIINGNFSAPGAAIDIDNVFHGPIIITGATSISQFSASAGSKISITAQNVSADGTTHNSLTAAFTAPLVTFSTDVEVLSSGNLPFSGNLTLDGHSFSLTNNNSVTIGGGTLNGTGQMLFGQSSVHAPSNGTLTVGPGVTLRPYPGATIAFNVGSTDTTFVNYGNISVDSNTATAYLYGNYWKNPGIINVSNGTLMIGGTVATADLGTITHTGGFLQLAIATLDNAGSVFTLDAARGNWRLQHSTIRGGTIAAAGGSFSTVNDGLSPSVFDGTTLQGDFSASTFSALTIVNNLTLASATLKLAGSLGFTGNQSLGGNGTILLEGGSIATSNGSFTIGPQVTLQTDTGGAQIGDTSNTSPLLLQGLVSSQTSNKTVTINGSLVTNQGTITAYNGGILVFNNLVNNHSVAAIVGSVTFSGTTTNNANISVTDGAATLAGPLLNNGNVSFANTSLTLAYYDPAATFGNFQHTGPTFFAASLSNSSFNLANTTLGATSLGAGATFSNVTLSNSAGVITVPAGNVTLNGTLATDAVVAPGGKLSGNISLQNANISLAGSSSGSANLSTSHLSGTGTIRFDGTPFQFVSRDNLSSTANLVIDSGIAIRTGTASGSISPGSNAQITNNGIISAETPNQTVTISTKLTNAGTLIVSDGFLVLPSTITNTGTITIGPNGTLITSTLASPGGTINRLGGSVYLSGGTVGTGNTIDLANTSWGRLDLYNAILSNLSLVSSDGPIFVYNIASPTANVVTVLSNVTLGTDLDAQQNANLSIRNGFVFSNSTIHLSNASIAFFSGYSLSGSGGVAFDGSLSNITGVAAIPAGINFHTGSTGGSIAGNVITLAGTISAQSSGANIAIRQTTLTISQGGLLQARNGGNISLSGPVTNSGQIDVQAPSILTVANTLTQNPNASLTGNGTLNAQNIAGSLTIPNTLNLTGTSVNVLDALTLTGASDNWIGKLNIGASDLLLHSSTGDLSVLQNQLRNNAITSSAAGASTAIALMSGSDYVAATSNSSFDGKVLSPTDLLLHFALLGDANLDNKVDISDLNTILQNFGQPSLSWTHGNFDYASTIDLTDLADVLNHLGQTFISPTLADPSPLLTPEPTSLALLSLTAPLLLKRRR